MSNTAYISTSYPKMLIEGTTYAAAPISDSSFYLFPKSMSQLTDWFNTSQSFSVKDDKHNPSLLEFSLPFSYARFILQKLWIAFIILNVSPWPLTADEKTLLTSNLKPANRIDRLSSH